eukprot:2804237-Rhodomonas_salina.1
MVGSSTCRHLCGDGKGVARARYLDGHQSRALPIEVPKRSGRRGSIVGSSRTLGGTMYVWVA